VEDGIAKGVVAFIDIGSNSVRLLVVHIRGGGFTVLREEKETIRLGDRVFLEGFLNDQAIERCVNTLKKFIKISKGFNVESIVAVATSALRDASNQKKFIRTIKNKVGLDVNVVSGKEEARLIYLGVSSDVNLGSKNALFIDVGGGSTELIIGNQYGHSVISSLNAGAIRLTSLFQKRPWDKEIENDTYQNMCSYVRAELMKSELRHRRKISNSFGSSGTIINLAEMTKGNKQNEALSLKVKDLKKLTDVLRALPLDERKKYPGINPDRADIIVGGAAILETVMDELHVQEIKVSKRGINYGLLVDYMSKIHGGATSKHVVREQSIQDMANTYHANNAHSQNVTRLSRELFDSSRKSGINKLGEQEKKLLKYSSLLHDVGNAIAYRDHNLHGEYIIKNSELLGFDQSEISVIASNVRFHMKRLPTRKDLNETGLSKNNRKVVKILSAFLRMAEYLDRSHLGHVKRAEIVAGDGGKASLLLYADEDIEVELWGLKFIQTCFLSVFGMKLKVDVLPTQLIDSN
jgi:exopolyphosphatase/guanosine-5'-triphosphate,3'-diphosphate pyrophosphatase